MAHRPSLMACPGCILIVDDDPDIRSALGEFMETRGCTVVEACDGAEGLAQLKHGQRPCLVLLDLNMPRLDGEGFACQVRNSPICSDLVILSMSAGSQELRPPLVDAHLKKPFEFRQLESTIARHCRER